MDYKTMTKTLQKPGSGRVDNLAMLATLDENSLLEEIQARYLQGVIYTYIGDILVSVNPYHPLPIYGHENEIAYSKVEFRTRLPPHIYAISDSCYQSMRRTGFNQCCVVSGESGAGKTETTKRLVEHIVNLSGSSGPGSTYHIHDRIIQVNPLLEAFGNAKTVMNDNSSRFGKYIELAFDNEGRILGAQISEYLLEKSRVVAQGMGERNFHIFYYLFAGLTQEQLRINLLDRPEQHRILRTIDGSPIYRDGKDFNYYQSLWDKLRGILDIVGFNPEEVNAMLAMLAAILHITDIQFDYDYDTDGVFIVYEDIMEIAAELLAVSPEDLASALISNVTYLRGEKIVSLKNKDMANDGRDALAKALYGRLFGWIVRQINVMLAPDQRYPNAPHICGILDMAGFENFEHNSFEQLCINVANEQLQFYFNQHIFQWELDEYKREGVKGKDIKYTDNRIVLEMMLEPFGMFSLIDEESRFPQASDASLVEKLTKNLNKHKSFGRIRGQQLLFTINHYAGSVVYNSLGFLEKNRDTLSLNLLDTMKSSDTQIVGDLFTAPLSETGSLKVNPNAPQRSRKSVLLVKDRDWSYTKTRSLSKKAGRHLKNSSARPASGESQYENTLQRTLGGHFKNSLTDLMSKLMNAMPQFVRCIRPNVEKLSGVFLPPLVLQQLRYCGVLETVRIRRLGYATRLPFHVFFNRYQLVAFKLSAKKEPTGRNCATILKKAGIKDKEYEIGKTKVFLRYWIPEALNQLMDVSLKKIVLSQAVIRGFLVRSKFRRLRELSRQDRAAVRGFSMYISKMAEDHFLLLDSQDRHDNERHKRGGQKRMIPRARSPSPPRGNRRSTSPYRHPPTAYQPPPKPSYPKPSYSPIQQSYEPPKQSYEPPGVSSLITQVQKSGPGTAPKKKPPGIFQATPLLLGNPVYGNPDPITSDLNVTRGLRQPKRRSTHESNEENTYPTETLYSPLKQSTFEYNENSHYSRPGMDRTEKFYSELIASTIESGKHQIESNPETWGKLYYMERSVMKAKLYLREDNIIIDNSSMDYDGYVIGLGCFDTDDSEVRKIKDKIEKGIEISCDKEGNLYARCLSKCDVVVKGYKEPQNHCLSPQVVESLGRVKDTKCKIFDMNEFRSQLALELRKPIMDKNRLYKLCFTSLAFFRNVFGDLDTPCWISIVSLRAMFMIGEDSLFGTLVKLSRMSLTESENAQLHRNWSNMNPKKSSSNAHHTSRGLNNNNPGKVGRRDRSPGYSASIARGEDNFPNAIYRSTNDEDPMLGYKGSGTADLKREWARKSAEAERQGNVFY